MVCHVQLRGSFECVVVLRLGYGGAMTVATMELNSGVEIAPKKIAPLCMPGLVHHFLFSSLLVLSFSPTKTLSAVRFRPAPGSGAGHYVLQSRGRGFQKGGQGTPAAVAGTSTCLSVCHSTR
ncbi:hypothetical protein TRVL_00251 [Trypanosoma vivax]|uniref:Uncharacterized protein n=1 Tax=Trypanosoma vivax (strain Y486) TaxID=1055687 RepID=G0TZF4_TRYVY|nr:hypothetical protein TRVL_00251 [Trypanosoma vivax]CCC49357.1 hypothetical protein TVY486_0706720 [Trypanosoma vivax Y486]